MVVVLCLAGCGGQPAGGAADGGSGSTTAGFQSGHSSGGNSSTRPGDAGSSDSSSESGDGESEAAGGGDNEDGGRHCVLSGDEWTCTDYAQPMPSCTFVPSDSMCSIANDTCLKCVSGLGHVFTCMNGVWTGTPAEDQYSCPE